MKNTYVLLTAVMLAVVLNFAACGDSAAGATTGADTTKVDSTPAAPTHDYAGAVVTLERSTCFGFCPSYTIKIEGNGKVSYEGRENVKVKGAQTAQITPEAVKALVDEFFAIDYFALQDSFDSPITDVAHYVTSLSIDGKVKRVFDRDGAPKKLQKLEDKIDEAAGSTQWVEVIEM
jgi:hypothetical protein